MNKLFIGMLLVVLLIICGLGGHYYYYNIHLDVFDRLNVRNGHAKMTLDEKKAFQHKIKTFYNGCNITIGLTKKYIITRTEFFPISIEEEPPKMSCDEYKEILEWRPYTK